MNIVSFFLVVICLLFSGKAFSENNKFCAVEIGSKGIKSVSYNFHMENGRLNAKAYFSQTENVTIITSAKDEQFTDQAMKEAAEATVRLMNKAEQALPGCKKFIVGSSGIVSRGRLSIPKFQKILSENTGIDAYYVTFINADAEANFALLSSVGNKLVLPESILIDIGSGNTKIGYINSSDGRFQSMELPWGSATLTKDAVAELGDFRHGYFYLVMRKIRPEFLSRVQKTPAVLNRKKIYWVGGAAWATFMWSHPEGISKDSVEISRSDIDNFVVALERKTWTERVAPKNLSQEDKLKWEKEFSRLQDTFTPENLLSGVGLMREILLHSNPKSKIIFPTNGQWLYGYTMQKFYDND